jgi:3-methyl-2-oxobutanoate hydroxymethyltransferase
MRLTVRDIQKMKTEGKPITMLTAYDAISARLSEAAGVEMILVGDTLGMVVQGHDSTIPVTLDQMIYHAEIVSRVTEKPLIVGDMPFMSVQVSVEQALKNCARMMQEAHVTVVKVEGGEFMAPTISRLVEAGIPVMAHIGLTPQSVNKFGGFRVQGKEVDTAQQLIRDAEAVQDAGAFAVVLELTPTPLSQIVTQRLHIPTIGIGAGIYCDGQVQVFHDILDLYQVFQPKHAKQYAKVGDMIRKGIEDFVHEVRQREFPTEKQSFSMKDEELTTLRAELDKEKANGSRRNH